MVFVRYGIPLLLAFTGIVLLFTVDKSVALEAWAGFTGAAIAVFLLNLLFRIGVQGDLERDREDEARAYFDRHGRWPSEDDGERPEPPPHREAPEPRLRPARPPRRG
jgi:hypothetical protein